MSRGNGGNGNGGTYQTCDRRGCQINGGVLRPGEARVCDDRGNVTHVVGCAVQVTAELYMYLHPQGMSVQQWEKEHSPRRSAARMQWQGRPPVSATA